MQATVLDPADVDGLESALEKNKVGVFLLIFLLLNEKVESPFPIRVLMDIVLSSLQVSLFFTESPTNPFLRCVDIERVSKLCHDKGALVCIDGTFATPLNQKALALGADLVVHSATKYIAGHNDVCRFQLFHTVFIHIFYIKIANFICLICNLRLSP